MTTSRAQNPVSVVGVGAVTPIGRDLAQITEQLQTQAPTADVRRVPDALLADPITSRRMRRADRFAKMTALASSDAWSNAWESCHGIEKHRIGLIVSTGFGPHGRGFKFLDGLLDCGDSAALPTDFSHSVHGAAAAYVTELLDVRGPALTNTDFETSFEHCVVLAQCWLNQGICDRVLLGAAEELGEVMLDCAGRMLNPMPAPPGEGAVFFVLAPKDVQGLACLSTIPTESAKAPGNCEPVHHFGLSASACAFNLLAGLLLKRPGPIDNPALLQPSSAHRTGVVLSL